jgi:lipoprotein-anchoring transpeptidase ErfK/SrfK
MSLRRVRPALLAGSALLLVAILTGCEADSVVPGSADDDPATGATTGTAGESSSEESPVRLSANVRRGATDVPVDRVVQVSAESGELTDVTLTSAAGELAGEVAEDGGTWTASDLLEPGTTYTLRANAEGADGATATRTARFTTQDLTLDEQTYPSVAPLDGETVGVGMPVIVSFDVPVTDRASIEKHLTVTSTPAQVGSWHWMSDTEVHWRPKTYWQADTDVTVDVDINSVPAGGGVYGQESRQVDFHVGDANVYKVSAKTHQMQVFSNDKLLRTIPITTGEQPAFTTRSGTKVIIEKFDSKTMNSETVGITGADAYNIDNVQWAMRLTYSGEFIHAAPWSVGSQGHANVSHGCTGMSTENAGWLYAMSKRGDVVEYVGTDKPMTLDNGYGDWNASYAAYAKGSALS